ncbi:hypothetical protein OG780_44340 [Streptomyces sp. NBC_00386]|uniref:hypothetical protein n=1 Tax=Streptomyces sp. NBC_00386 TaxID=2975734 RepID=UPI002E1D6729
MTAPTVTASLTAWILATLSIRIAPVCRSEETRPPLSRNVCQNPALSYEATRAGRGHQHSRREHSIDAQTYPGAYEGVKLSYVAFSATGNSDEATGRDAFLTTATAVGKTGAHRSRSEVLQQLRAGVEVPESTVQDQVLTVSSRTFTVADWNRDMAARDLWICDAPSKPGGKKECHTPSRPPWPSP